MQRPHVQQQRVSSWAILINSLCALDQRMKNCFSTVLNSVQPVELEKEFNEKKEE